MEPITAIVTALSLGAAAVLKVTTDQLIKDGYTALKTLIKSKLPQASASVDQLEHAPDSKARRAVVEEDLTKEGAGSERRDTCASQGVVRHDCTTRSPDS